MKEREEQRGKVKQSLFPVSLFGIYIGVLFLMSGIHTGLIVFMNSAGWNKAVMTVVSMCYWGMVAMGLTLFTRWKVKRTYEEPLYKMAEATRKVANGDFSVYVPTFHTMEKRDYLDVMILDFNKMVEELGSIETLKTDFVSNVSHEMKTPLSIIKNCAELLQRDALSEEQRREYGEAIENTATRLSDLISNILKLNKLENQNSLCPLIHLPLCIFIRKRRIFLLICLSFSIPLIKSGSFLNDQTVRRNMLRM